ncbi:Hypothetical predicted protein [Mytilus galloprovincialis]|uniref:Uncharacterized protein n=1 Tax=Mytilus galloprovincialis TaxID=29158 RepID=A0A8B6FTG7_MYTGA|nr:Hypothetical predicted protein [Mytilus galloprovincialis]
MINIDLRSQEFKLNAAEQNTFAEVYFHDNTDEVKKLSEKYVFFPLVCSLYHKQNLQEKVSVTSFFRNPFGVFKDQVVQIYGESDAASQNGHVNVVKELLPHSVGINKCDNNGVSPLYKASQNGHVDVVKELLQHSADVHKCTNDGTSPLQIVSNNNKVSYFCVLSNLYIVILF